MILKLCLLAILAIFGGAYGIYTPRQFIRIDSVAAISMDRARGSCYYSRSEKVDKIHPIVGTVRRGAMIHINGFKNDRTGGFVRFSMVPVSKMFMPEAHNRLAFMYSCADTRTYKCNRNETEMCKDDPRNEHYRYYVKVPYIHPNGIYVLAMARYGSFTTQKVHPRHVRGLGDYYSCVRIRIKGGPVHRKFTPRFSPGPTRTGTHSSCLARYNDIRCASRYCSARAPIQTRPMEFMHDKKHNGTRKDKKRPSMTMSGWPPKKRAEPYMRDENKGPEPYMRGENKRPEPYMRGENRPSMNMSGRPPRASNKYN